MTGMAVIAIVLAAVFLVSGSSKLGRVTVTQEMLQRFRISPALASRSMAAILPIVEIGLGVGLLAAGPPLFTGIAVGVFILTATFVLMVWRAHRSGEVFDCGCFGSLTSTPISRALINRNTALMVFAGSLVIAGGFGFPGTPGALAHLTPTDITWTAVTAAVAITAVLFVRAGATPPNTHHGTDSESNSGEGFHRIPEVEVVTTHGEVRQLTDLVSLEPVLLLFIRPGCSSCEQITTSVLGSDSTARVGPARVVLAVDAAPHVFLREHPDLADSAVFAVKSAREKLGATRTPAAVLIGLNGEWVAGPVTGLAEVSELVSRTPNLLAGMHSTPHPST
jgi:hypothetical protein